MEERIVRIINDMADVLNIFQLRKLQEVLINQLVESKPDSSSNTNEDYVELFLEAKLIEGCSDRTISYYRSTLQHFVEIIDEPIRKVSTETIRNYLVCYQKRNSCSKVTVDNIRRNISSFFSWLEEEDYILKSPMRRIHKIKTVKEVKGIISDEGIEKLRDACTSVRDLAMIDLLYSTGIRVGELVRLNKKDVDFEARECVVFGKGGNSRLLLQIKPCGKLRIANILRHKSSIIKKKKTRIS